MNKKIIALTGVIVLGIGGAMYAGSNYLWHKSTKADVSKVLKNIKYLSSEFKAPDYRQAGTTGEKRAGQFIKNSLKECGYKVTEDAFAFEEVLKEKASKVTFKIKGKEIKTTTAKIISPKDIDENFKGSLVDLGSGAKEDYQRNKDRLKGNFALINVDEKTSIDDFTLLQASGLAKGIIVYDKTFIAPPPSADFVATRYVLSEKVHGEEVTTVTTISKKDYEFVHNMLSKNKNLEIDESIRYSADRISKSSQNIVAESSDNDNADKPLIIIGAHYDGVDCAAADDNASGTAALIEVARVLSEENTKFDIKLVAFGSEEVGLFGSRHFVESLDNKDKKRCKLMINLDGPGLGEVFIVGKSTGEESELAERVKACKLAEENNYTYRKLDFPDSDQFYFANAGIPTITFASLELDGKKQGSLKVDKDYHDFNTLAGDGIIIPKGNHTKLDGYDAIEKSEAKNGNFKKLFKVMFEILEV